MCFKECFFTFKMVSHYRQDGNKWKYRRASEQKKKRNENLKTRKKEEKSKRNLHLAPFCALFPNAVSLRSFSLRHYFQLFGKSAGKPTLLFNKQNVLRHYNPKGMRRRQKNANCTAQETTVQMDLH